MVGGEGVGMSKAKHIHVKMSRRIHSLIQLVMLMKETNNKNIMH